ncbi:hypothetical protein [Prauserella flavalba]|uniref:Uncharacterized protein n=1 Tax=Prauserella flavalba TaxID=1477506 RepID=A0A318L8N9_9PSEU|nr:hypothetical protein [Prauserella flavalba]PXY16697.1 hypothetical protein BA062_38520 [Prauserella flavalba]
MDGVVNLLGGETAPPHRHLMSAKDVADCPPLDAEPRTEFVNGCSGLVSGDEFLDLASVELACPSWFGPDYRRWSRLGGVWKLPEQGLQGFYLGFCVVVSSPKVHR